MFSTPGLILNWVWLQDFLAVIIYSVFIMRMSLIFHAVDTALPWMLFSLINLVMLQKMLCHKEAMGVFWTALLLISHYCSYELNWTELLPTEIWNLLCCQMKSSLFCLAEGTFSFPLPNYLIVSSPCDIRSFFTFHCFAHAANISADVISWMLVQRRLIVVLKMFLLLLYSSKKFIKKC